MRTAGESYAPDLSVGVVQTTVDAEHAWHKGASSPRMSECQDDHAWLEIGRAMRSFRDGSTSPKLVLLPELTIPRTRLDEFARLVGALNVIAVVGVDYQLDLITRTARNEGIVFIPTGLADGRPSRYCSRIVFGKTFAAPAENEKINGLKPAWSFVGDPNVYLFDFGKYGRFGVSICYDFMDIERALMYRGQIQHLFVIAYNRDLGMFRSLAESLSRTVYCNVVICNTGYYGGSLAVSPYYKPHLRTVYSHEGNGLFSTQVVQLPVAELIRAALSQSGCGRDSAFKTPPPGFAIGGAVTGSGSANAPSRQIVERSLQLDENQ